MDWRLLVPLGSTTHLYTLNFCLGSRTYDPPLTQLLRCSNTQTILLHNKVKGNDSRITDTTYIFITGYSPAIIIQHDQKSSWVTKFYNFIAYLISNGSHRAFFNILVSTWKDAANSQVSLTFYNINNFWVISNPVSKSVPKDIWVAYRLRPDDI
jgi:hypothetical protein